MFLKLTDLVQHIDLIDLISHLCRSTDAYVNCKIVATPGKYDFKPYAFGFQKDSPFLPLFDYYLNEMKEKGILKQIQVKYRFIYEQCVSVTLFRSKLIGSVAIGTIHLE